MQTSQYTDENSLQIQQRCDAATAGPWKAFIQDRDHESGSRFIQTAGPDIELSGAKEADYDFIANARQDMPRLLDDVRRLRALLARSNHCHTSTPDTADALFFMATHRPPTFSPSDHHTPLFQPPRIPGTCAP